MKLPVFAILFCKNSDNYGKSGIFVANKNKMIILMKKKALFVCGLPTSLWAGFLIGGGLVIAGLMLELSVGPVDWNAFRWPVNGIVLAGFLALIAIFFLLRKRVYVFQFISTYKAAIPALVYAVVLTVVMGVTPQKDSSLTLPREGTMWINYMLSFWPFVLIYVYIAVILGLTVLRQLKSWTAALQRHSLKEGIFSLFTLHSSLFSHLGLFLAMTMATLGNADMQRLKMITVKGEPEWRALTSQQQIVKMPFAIELKEFIMETYDNGSPKRFASDIIITPNSTLTAHPSPLTPKMEATIEVNKPAEYDGWKIYQYGYDTQMGAMSQYSILELISDPWLPLVYTGIYLMLAGALLMIVRAIPWRQGVQQTRNHPKTALLLCAVIAACFFCVHHFMPILHSKTLVPALQSPWFKPHIIAYMLAYTLMASAAVIALLQLIKGAGKDNALTSHLSPLTTIVFVGISLITIGMLFGALWAKEAWGDYWSWDPKETWAAITWFAYLVYVHYRQIPTHRPRIALWALLISFVLLQMCWWGINYLPAAQGSSVHVYNMPS